jgi:hypothetical protein
LIVNILMHALRKKLSSETRNGDAFTDGRLRSGKVRRTYIRRVCLTRERLKRRQTFLWLVSVYVKPETCSFVTKGRRAFLMVHL